MTPESTAQLGKLAALLFMMMGPVAIMPGFAMLTASADPALTRRIALRAALYATAAVVLAVLLGYGVLTGWGASPSSLIIAAGLLLLLSSVGSVLAKPEAAAAAPAPTGTRPPPPLEIALSPLAFPMIVTPPAIGVLIIFTAYFQESGQQAHILATGLGIVAVNLLAMLAARRVMGWIGMVPLRILGAVFGVLQVALAIEFIISGLLRSKLMG